LEYIAEKQIIFTEKMPVINDLMYKNEHNTISKNEHADLGIILEETKERNIACANSLYYGFACFWAMSFFSV